MTVAVNGEIDGFKIDVGGRVYRILAPWIGGISKKESVTSSFLT